MLIGQQGRNWWLVHRGTLIRADPTQLRYATQSEGLGDTCVEEVLKTAKGRLEEIKHGTHGAHTYLDLTKEAVPPGPVSVHESPPTPPTAETPPSPPPTEIPPSPAEAPAAEANPDVPVNEQVATPASKPARRLWAKTASSSNQDVASGPSSLKRPIQAVEEAGSRSPERKPVPSGQLRAAELESTPPEALLPMGDIAEVTMPLLKAISSATQARSRSPPPDAALTCGVQSNSADTSHCQFDALCEAERELSRADTFDYASLAADAIVHLQQLEETRKTEWQQPYTALLAGALARRARKELSLKGASKELRTKAVSAQALEIDNLITKGCLRPVRGAEAMEVLRRYPDRFIPGRFVMTEKQEEDQPIKVKARWCLRGDLDPDLTSCIQEGKLQSPTITSYGRAVCLQMIASHRWDLQFGDVQCAFPEARSTTRPKPLFTRLPKGHSIPGFGDEEVLEVTGNLYGKNDAPYEWWKEYDTYLKGLGFQASRFDPCLYLLREDNRLWSSGRPCGRFHDWWGWTGVRSSDQGPAGPLPIP